MKATGGGCESPGLSHWRGGGGWGGGRLCFPFPGMRNPVAGDAAGGRGSNNRHRHVGQNGVSEGSWLPATETLHQPPQAQERNRWDSMAEDAGGGAGLGNVIGPQSLSALDLGLHHDGLMPTQAPSSSRPHPVSSKFTGFCLVGSDWALCLSSSNHCGQGDAWLGRWLCPVLQPG